MDAPQWMKDEIAELVAKHGSVPPPWAAYPDEHPCSICWRMGGGESLIMIFGAWWEQEKKTRDEAQRIEYFRQWPPPARWLEWMIDAVWDPQASEEGYNTDFDYSPYFARTEALGFGSQADFDRDFNAEIDEDGDEQEEGGNE